MIEPSSPILEFYPEEFHTDLNGKQQDWEAVVLIPFVNEVCADQNVQIFQKLFFPLKHCMALTVTSESLMKICSAISETNGDTDNKEILIRCVMIFFMQNSRFPFWKMGTEENVIASRYTFLFVRPEKTG